MSGNRQLLTRRSAIVSALAVAGASVGILANLSAVASNGEFGMADESSPTGHEHDWDWLVGRWSVRHRRLKERLAGSTEWEEFAGTSAMWLTLGGLGTVDDNLLELPSGMYRAVGIRAFDPGTNLWSIWWLDARKTTIDPPVRGGFKDGVGTFIGDDTLRGKPIKVRFMWTDIKPRSAKWAQAFSGDNGTTWETNWEMWFSRQG